MKIPEVPRRDALATTRLRLRDDYGFYARNSLKIRSKDAKIVPLKLNRAQMMLEDAINDAIEKVMPIRIIILKSRQQGLSTAVGGYLYFRVSQWQAKKAIVVTHKSDSTTALFAMTKRFHENVPEILKPSTSYSSKRELVFDKLDSSYIVATAGGDGIARGETITDAHLSELAFWPPNVAKENLTGLLQSIPEVPGTSVFIESTANGVTGPFFDMWQKAVSGENGYTPIFIPWFYDTEYRTEPPRAIDPTPEEITLKHQVLQVYDIELDDAQLWWRRVKINQIGSDLFKQEYPAFPEEAFLTTGRPVFDVEALHHRLQVVDGPIYRMAHIIDKFEQHPVGELSVYREIDPGDTYYIGADVAMGVRGGDYSVAQVLDSKKRQVACWRGHVHPDYFSDVLYALGIMYNTAKIAVEQNNHGLLTVTRLYKDLHYPSMHMDVVEDKMTDVDTPFLGFRTTSKSRPLIIDDLRSALRKGDLVLHDKTTMQEMMTFVVTESGKPEAEEGCHDDCVMALAICNHIHDGVWTPIEVTDAFYVESI